MTIKEAEDIVHSFGKVIENSEKYFAKPISLLPCSKGKITLAFYLWAEKIVMEKQMTDEIHTTITVSYSQLANFVDDNYAVEINNIFKTHKDDSSKNPNFDEKDKKFNDYLMQRLTLEKYLWGELNDFLCELLYKVSPYIQK